MPLPALKRFVPQMAKNLFKLLKKYARAGAKVGENYEMVLVAFKVNNSVAFPFGFLSISSSGLSYLSLMVVLMFVMSLRYCNLVVSISDNDRNFTRFQGVHCGRETPSGNFYNSQ